MFRPHRPRQPWFLASRGSTHPLSGQSWNTHLINQGINICNNFVAWCSAVECSSQSSLPEFPPTSTCLNKIVKYDQVSRAKIVVGKCDRIWYFAHLIEEVFPWSNSKISCWKVPFVLFWFFRCYCSWHRHHVIWVSKKIIKFTFEVIHRSVAGTFPLVARPSPRSPVTNIQGLFLS